MQEGEAATLIDNVLLRAILDGLEDLVYICSEDRRVLFMNRAMIRRVGRDATGEACHQVMPDMENACVWCADDTPSAGNRTTEARSSRDSRVFKSTHLTVPTPNGNTLRLAIFRDITEHVDAEAGMNAVREECVVRNEELERLFKKIEDIKKEWERTMDCLGDLVLLVNDDGKVVRCNRPAKEFFGSSYEALKGCGWKGLFDEYLHVSADTLRSGAEICHEPSGRWFLYNIYPFSPVGEGGMAGLVITLHDTTELHRSREETETAYAKLAATHNQLVQQEKMASIGQLAAGVAHEINNPIGFVNSNLGTLSKYVGRLAEFMDFQEQVVAECPASLERISAKRAELKIDRILNDAGELIRESLEGTDRVRRIVQDLKSFSHAEEEESKPADINDCLDSTVNIVWNELKYKVTLVKEYGELPLVTCWPQQLKQVFMNLLMNAAQSIERQGEIRIRTWQEGGSVLVSVSDTGCGMPAEQLERIFEPFFTTKEIGKGTGLGLSISYDIVKKHGGDIFVTSEVGKGTTFTIRLPVAGQ
ncbi:MAG: PAS domain-containing protein [Geobacter sp.]|nr:PAS domain-containing protein [Geobacter sp.]